MSSSSSAPEKTKDHPSIHIREGNYLKSRENREAAVVDIEQMIDDSGCAEIYYQLENCLGEHDRKWQKCQVEVKNLQDCAKKHKKHT